jgi:hypothetical protein
VAHAGLGAAADTEALVQVLDQRVLCSSAAPGEGKLGACAVMRSLTHVGRLGRLMRIKGWVCQPIF